MAGFWTLWLLPMTLIIESFGVGGLPNYGNDSFLNALSDWISAGKLVCMATQVTHEGSDMEVYQVGKVIKEKFPFWNPMI